MPRIWGRLNDDEEELIMAATELQQTRKGAWAYKEGRRRKVEIECGADAGIFRSGCHCIAILARVYPTGYSCLVDRFPFPCPFSCLLDRD